MNRTYRFLASALTGAALLCAVSVPAFAGHGYQQLYPDKGSSFNSPSDTLTQVELPSQKDSYLVTPPSHFYENGHLLDLVGSSKFPMGKPDGTSIANGKDHLELDPATDWDTLKGDWNCDMIFAYVPHSHSIPKNTPWSTDHNHHYKICPVCKKIAYINWHHDVNNDGFCDQCGDPIFYRHVTVKDTTGGKVEVSKEKCMLGNRVTVTVKPDAGYHLAEIHGINNNDMHSVRPCFAHRAPGEYHLVVDVWDIEVQATFEKD